MSKRRPSGELFLRGSANPPPQQHLYLIFDGLGSEYGIRKVDLNQLLPTASTIKARKMPPPDFRLHAPRGMPMYFAAAFNTKILAMHPRELNGVVHPMVSNNYFLVLDVHTPSLMYGPQPKAPRIDPIYIPVGDDMLFALAVGCFEVLYAPPPPPSPDEPRHWEWSWFKLMKPPFKPKNVTSYTVHPDGRTIFVSVEKGASASTFTFDALMESSEWKLCGQWMLPFTGRAYFDHELDAWVGLSRDQETIGHVCCCSLISPNSDAGDGQDIRTLKLCKEKLFSEEPSETHVGATLLHLGGGSNFCLVQCISVGPRYSLRVLTFSLKYDCNGDLTLGKSCMVLYYKVPKSVSESVLKYPLAFWL